MDVSKEQKTKPTPHSISAFADFLGQVEITSFRRRLRNLLLYYLIAEWEELARRDERFIEDMAFFFDFLDVIEDEQGN